MSLATKRLRPSPTAATRSGRFICPRQRSHRSPLCKGRWLEEPEGLSNASLSPFFSTLFPGSHPAFLPLFTTGLVNICAANISHFVKQNISLQSNIAPVRAYRVCEANPSPSVFCAFAQKSDINPADLRYSLWERYLLTGKRYVRLRRTCCPAYRFYG